MLEVDREAYPHVAKAHDYVRDVFAGKVPACKWVKAACKRHERDLERAARGEFGYTFDLERAEDFCRFAELLPHVKDHWADRQELIVLQPWQCFIGCAVFGWVGPTGQRRFRRVYVEVPRKCGKSTFAATIGLYCFAADGVHGAEVYSGATTEEQAWEVFRPARLMVDRTPDLREAFGIEVNAKALTILADGSRFKPVIGKPGDGASPSCAIVDEYHEHETDDLADTMLTGMGARAMFGSPLMLYITTAGDDTAGPCYALRNEVTQVLDGVLPGDSIFGIIYTIDESDRWTTEAALRKANPNYGISVAPAFLLDEQQKAIADGRKQGVFKTKHLNVWVSARAAWMNMEDWKRCAKPGGLSWEECFSWAKSCDVGLDMAAKTDFCSARFVFRNGDRVRLKSLHFLPEDTASDPAKQHYLKWVNDGHIIATPGGEIDFGRVEAELIAKIQQSKARNLLFDAMYGTQVAQNVAHATGINRLDMPMGQAKTFSPAMYDIEAAAKTGRIEHDDNPVDNWMMSNVVSKTDARGNQYPRKARRENKIDGAVATILGWVPGLTATADQPTRSIYESRGFLVL